MQLRDYRHNRSSFLNGFRATCVPVCFISDVGALIVGAATIWRATTFFSLPDLD